jgi:tRNA-splicing ligase RtcB
MVGAACWRHLVRSSANDNQRGACEGVRCGRDAFGAVSFLVRSPYPGRVNLEDEREWRQRVRLAPGGYWELRTEDTREVPVRLFMSERQLQEAETSLYRQIVAATRFCGVRCVVITPDVHFGYGVPVGCVIATAREHGAVALGPVGFDIGCGMLSARSDVPAAAATPERRLQFNRAVMGRVSLGAGGKSLALGAVPEKLLLELVKGGAAAYERRFGAVFDRRRTERQCFHVSDSWSPPWGGPGFPERGLEQLGSLGGGNHFIELQSGTPASVKPWELRAGTLHVQLHTGSRGFGHGLATNYFDLARKEHPEHGAHIDLGYFTPESPHYDGYLDAVAAGANFAIINRLLIFEQVAQAFRKVFHGELELIYELSHNLVQAEHHPEFGDVWMHRKGATRAFPAGHSELRGTEFFEEGHPVLVPGSNHDESYILRPLAGAERSLYSVNHGAGRRMSRGAASKLLDQRQVDDAYRREGIVVNDDGKVPLDESGACYKPAEEVMAVVLGAGLAEVKTRLWPLASLKGTESGLHQQRAERRASAKERALGRRLTRQRKQHDND